jgi:small-conductance mechanosensitive channel
LPRFIATILLSAAATIFWLVYRFASGYQVFGTSLVADGLHVVAWAATGVLMVFVAGQLILRVGLVALLDVEPTGLQRGTVFTLLTFGVSAVVLTQLGMNLSAVLTTSVLLTGVIGLALQSTLGSLIAGYSLHIDRVMRIGDGIVLNGEQMEVTALTWRSVIARKLDDTTVVITNGRISDAAIQVLPRDRPVRAETFVQAPVSLPPERMSELVGEIVGDLPQIDSTRPIEVAPAAFEPDKAATRYRIRYWIRHYTDRSDVDGEILRRVWYAFQREVIPWPVSNIYEERLRRKLEEREIRAVARRVLLRSNIASLRSPAPSEAELQALAEEGDLLLFAAGERIVLPGRVESAMFLLIDGELSDNPYEFHNLHATAHYRPAGPPDGAASNLTRRAAVKQIADRLAEHIGPYAEYVVEQAAAADRSLRAIRETVAAEIEDGAARQDFLRGNEALPRETYGPGFIFRARRDSAGSIVSEPRLRAAGKAAVLPIPAQFLSPTDALPAR